MYDYYDDYDDYEISWYESFSYKKLLPLTHKNVQAAKIIKRWYEEEEAYDDFYNAEEYVAFIEDDLPNMYDAATNESEKRIVAEACPDLIEDNYDEDDPYDEADEDDYESEEEELLSNGYSYEDNQSLFDSED